MRTLSEGRKSYPEDPTYFFEFERFASEAGDFVLCEGWFDYQLLEQLRGEKVVYLEFEEPNRFLSSDALFNHLDYEDYFHKIFTICPYTARWLNRKYGNEKRTPVFFPFNERYIPPRRAKEFEVIYTGHISIPPVLKLVRELSEFNYRCVSHNDHPLVTDRDVSYACKLDLISRSKVTLVHNLLYPNWKHVRALQSNMDGFAENEAFDLTPRRFNFLSLIIERVAPALSPDVVMPQLKSRLFEAAFCRSLILCLRDHWNIVEQFFTPGVEFIYYEKGRLGQTLREILKNYDDYQCVIDRAFERAAGNYTTEVFFRKYLKPLR
jgi:hypothetical protein